MTTSHSFAQMLVDEPTEVITPLDQGEGSLELDTPDQAETIQPLTPIMDSIDGFRSIDWANVRRQCRAGINNVGVAIAVISEKTHQLGCWLAEV